MKGRLALPGFILIFAILVLPIPALFAARISATQYAATTTLLLLLVVISVFAARRTVRYWRSHGPPSIVTRLARLVPFISRLSRLHERAGAAESLCINISSGVAAQQALDNMLRATTNAVYRESLRHARNRVQRGSPLCNSLRDAGLIDAGEGYAIINAGEHAGRLEDVLERFSERCHDRLDDIYDVLAQWIPVAVYLAVVGVVAAGLLG